MTATLPSEQVRTEGRAPRRLRPARPPRATRPPRPPASRDEPVTVVSTSLVMLSLLCLWMVFQLVLLGGLSQTRAQDLLYAELRTQLASATAPIGPVVPAGDPVALLSAPRIGLQQTVVEGTGSGDTLAGPGHLRNTVLPGQAGTSVLMGRAQTYGGPFADLAGLAAGDTITTVTAQGTTAFTVLGVRRAGDPLPQPLPAGSSRLTLVTSESSGALGGLTSGSVLYVDADAATAFATPAGRPAAVPDAERPLATDPGALPLLVLHLTVLLALTLGVIAARQRFAAALVWVVATPVALTVAWSTTDVAMRMLPNLL